MPTRNTSGSRALLRSLRSVLAGAGFGRIGAVSGEEARAEGLRRLDIVVNLVASNMVAEVCSIYLKRDERTLELCATEGLRKDAVHSARLRIGQGLVGRIAERAQPIATDGCPERPRLPATSPRRGEEVYQLLRRRADPAPRRGPRRAWWCRTAWRGSYSEDEVDGARNRRHGHRRDVRGRRLCSAMAKACRQIPDRRMPPAVMVQGRLRLRGHSPRGSVHLHEPRVDALRTPSPRTCRGRAHAAWHEAMAALRGDLDRADRG